MKYRASAGVMAGLFGYAVFCSWLGIDFGDHWDERYTVIRLAQQSVRNGTILPHSYLYPSLLHDLTLAAAIPDALILASGGDDDIREGVAARIDTPRFLLRLRRVVSSLSALSAVWVFLAMLLWRRQTMEGLLAAAIVTGSWELQYHSRWLTVDPLMAQFGALTLFLAVGGHSRQSPWMLRLAGGAAGLACSTKYPGGMLLLPVLLACFFADRPVRRSLEAVGLFAITLLVITPGALVEPYTLMTQLGEQVHIYGSSWGPYTVEAPLEHARLLSQYVTLVQLSHFVPAALFLSLAAFAGIAILISTDWRAALIVTAFPVAYFAYFCMQRVMIVRNVLVLIPFLAVLASIGIDGLLRLLPTRLSRALATAAVIAILLLNLGWLLVAARSIATSAPGDFVADAALYLQRNADKKSALTPEVQEVIEQYEGQDRKVIPPMTPGVDEVIFFGRQIPWSGHQANIWNYTKTWFGPYEVNYNYYPTWIGRDRIVVADPKRVPYFRDRARR